MSITELTQCHVVVGRSPDPRFDRLSRRRGCVTRSPHRTDAGTSHENVPMRAHSPRSPLVVPVESQNVPMRTHGPRSPLVVPVVHTCDYDLCG